MNCSKKLLHALVNINCDSFNYYSSLSEFSSSTNFFLNHKCPWKLIVSKGISELTGKELRQEMKSTQHPFQKAKLLTSPIKCSFPDLLWALDIQINYQEAMRIPSSASKQNPETISRWFTCQDSHTPQQDTRVLRSHTCSDLQSLQHGAPVSLIRYVYISFFPSMAANAEWASLLCGCPSES